MQRTTAESVPKTSSAAAATAVSTTSASAVDAEATVGPCWLPYIIWAPSSTSQQTDQPCYDIMFCTGGSSALIGPANNIVVKLSAYDYNYYKKTKEIPPRLERWNLDAYTDRGTPASASAGLRQSIQECNLTLGLQKAFWRIQKIYCMPVNISYILWASDIQPCVLIAWSCKLIHLHMSVCIIFYNSCNSGVGACIRFVHV